MKKMLITLTAILMFSMVSYAGEWKSDDRGYWYQNDNGTWKTGWFQDTDGKWYYLDDQSGYMLAGTTTPDGYTLSEDGVWIQEIPQKKVVYNGEEYDRKAELTITSYSIGPADVEVLEYPLPVTVYYNNTYSNVYGGTIKILGVETTVQGAPYIRFHADTEGGAYDLKAHCRYNLINEKHTDSIEDIFGYSSSGGTDGSHHLLWRDISNAARRSSNLISADICIKEGSLN